MVDRIQKALNKFSEKERELVKDLLYKIKNNKLDNVDIKKLKGRDDIYRVRKGKIRIIFRIHTEETYLLAIERRSDRTHA